MKLTLFDKIDKTIELLNARNEEYDSIRRELKYTFMDVLEKDNVLDITTRVKTPNSLREKIIRNQYYLAYETPKDILDNLADLIGLKIDCRFIQEEFEIYQHLKDVFCVEQEDKFFSCSKHGHIALDMNSLQPQTQKNGYSIYRIDGYYRNNNEKINFELQIKSLVNTFWGDIEHKLVYKNTNYVMYDNFMKDMLSSIKANLTIIDRQLLAVNDAMQSNTDLSQSFMNNEAFENMISKAINDLCAEKLTNTIGFSLNIKDTSNILGSYIFHKNVKKSKGETQLKILFQLFNGLREENIDFENEIIINKQLTTDDPFVSEIGNIFLDIINEDYHWFVFFRILFALEPGNNDEDFLLFLNVYKANVIDEQILMNSFLKLDPKEAEIVRYEIQCMCAQILGDIEDIKIVENKYLGTIKEAISSVVDELDGRVIDENDFNNYKDAYRKVLDEAIRNVFL